MKKSKVVSSDIETELFLRYPKLLECREAFELAYNILLESYKENKKVLLAGNGGSAADSEHIVGELMKSFLFDRRLDSDLICTLKEHYGDDGEKLIEQLEGGLPAIPLTSMPALSTAYANDTSSAACFAQMTQVLGCEGDVFLGISTSGNSENILLAIMAAKARHMHTICLTGKSGGKCKGLADVCICVPEDETFKVQELHLPVYHALCAMIESELFEQKEVGK